MKIRKKAINMAKLAVCAALVLTVALTSTVYSSALSYVRERSKWSLTTRTNVSPKAVTNENDSFPDSLRMVIAGKPYYINMSSKKFLKKAILHVKPVGADRYIEEYSFEDANYFKYINHSYTFAKMDGIFRYYWEIIDIDGNQSRSGEHLVIVLTSSKDSTMQLKLNLNSKYWNAKINPFYQIKYMRRDIGSVYENAYDTLFPKLILKRRVISWYAAKPKAGDIEYWRTNSHSFVAFT